MPHTSRLLFSSKFCHFTFLGVAAGLEPCSLVALLWENQKSWSILRAIPTPGGLCPDLSTCLQALVHSSVPPSFCGNKVCRLEGYKIVLFSRQTLPWFA